MDLHQVSRMKMNFLLMLVGLVHGLGVGSFNPLPDLSMEILNLFGSLFGLSTKFGGSRDGSKVQRGPWIIPIDHLKWGELSGLTQCSINMGKEFIPPFHKHPKQGSQGSVGHLRLGMTSGAKLEVSPHLS